MYRAMYERKYKSNADNLRDEDLAEFVWQCVLSVLHLTNSLESCLRSPATSRKGKAAAKKTSAKVNDAARSPQSPASSSTSDPSLEVIMEEKAELFLWERSEGYFVLEAAVSARIVQRKGDNYSFFLTATSQEGQVLAHRISSQMMQRWSPTTWSLTWNNVNENRNQSSWCMRFESQEAFEGFRAEFTKRAWESLNQTSWNKIKVKQCEFMTWRTHIFFAGRRPGICDQCRR
jgi:VID27 PH-like domain